MPFSKSVLFSRLVSLLTRNISARWIRLVCLVGLFAIALSSLPAHLKHDSATAQGSRPQRTQGPPSRNLPNLDEARGIEPGTPKIMPPVPATKCRGRDEKCKKAREKISYNFPENQDRLLADSSHRSGQDYIDWLNIRNPALSTLAYLIYWPASMISDFPDIPYRYDGGALAESAVKGSKPRGESYGNATSGGPRKYYSNRSGRSRSPVAAQSGGVVTIYPGAYQTPDPGQGGWAINSPSNTGGSASLSITNGSAKETCKWYGFPSVSGQIVSARLKMDWSASGSVNGTMGGGGGFSLAYTGGSAGASLPSSSQSSSVDFLLPAGQDLTQVQVSMSLNGGAGPNTTFSGNASVSNIRIEVTIAPPVISNVAAGGITSSGATITWTTDYNSDSQVEYGTTGYTQSTALNPTLVTAHSQGLSGLTVGTLYHYHVKSRDAYGNLTVSSDFTFTTLPNDAAFVSQSVPATMTAGEAYAVTVRMLNQGTSTWTPGQLYRLGSQNPQDNTTWGLGRVSLSAGDSVSPGATTTFSFVVTAPSSPGSYNFQWQMVQDGVEWFGAKTPNMAIQVVPRVDQAQFVSQSVPSVMTRQNAYSVSVTMKNTGNTTWDSNYRLGSQNPQDNGTWGLGRVYLASGETIPPGGSKTFTFTVTAPASPGIYALFQWRMVHEGVQWFGDYSSVVVVTLSPGNLNMALIDPINHIGSPGGDLLSRNYNWSLPLLSLPGRAGLDLGLALSLNSLVYTKAGSDIYFAPGYPAPGFSMGFPEIRNAFLNTEANTQSYLLTMPSGRRVEFRQTNTNVYEAVDSSYMLLTYDPVNLVYILYTTDGTQCRFVDVTGLGDYKCTQIKDRQGNYITIGYGSLAEIRTVTDTLGRVINFNYDEFNHLLSITQNWGGQTHTWAAFAYGTQTVQTNFPGLTLNGTANGTPESVLMRVGLADGSVYSFEYNTYCQVKTIRHYAPNNSNPVNFPDDYVQRAYTTYGLPDNANDPQTDCPRITSRIDWASDWNSGVTSTYDADPGLAWGKVTFPDGTIYKEFFATSGWQRGLTTQTENWSGDVRKKWTTLQYTQDNTGVVYQLNPRVTETNVYDEAGNRRRTTMSYTSFGLPSDVNEYDADTTTLLRRKHIDYNLSAVYTDRRIIGLPSAQFLYDGANNLFSKVDYQYDLGGGYQVHQGPPVQHDTANYGSGFVQGRGNLNKMRRWDVTDPNKASLAAEYETGYNTSGSVIFTRDPLDHQTSVSFADSFSDGQNRNTYAYPTTATDPDNFSSTVQYNYDFGAVTRTEDPKGAAVTRTYDAAGRIERTTNVVNGAYTRYVYAPDQRQVESFTTINDLDPANEFRTVTVFDGLDRVRATASDHPTSVGQYKAQYNVYDVMGRLASQSKPTEVDSDWSPSGDDQAIGWGPAAWSSQTYDWQGRPLVSTNRDGSTRIASYQGCGCSGGDVTTLQGEPTSTGTPENRRTQKIWRDTLGRSVKSQILNYDGTPYSTTLTEYNVRDQVTAIKTFKGDAEIGADCALGNCQQVENVYDGHGRLQKQYLPIYQNPNVGPPYNGNPSARSKSMQYFGDDRVYVETDPRGATATYTYNNRGLVTGIGYFSPSGVSAKSPVTFTYDELGNRQTMVNGEITAGYNYNTLGQMMSESRTFTSPGAPPGTFTINYDYGLAGQLKYVRDPFGDQINYGYNKAGELTSVTGETPFAGQTDYVGALQYRAWGAVKSGRTYDKRMRLTSWGNGAVSYQYNQASDMTYAQMNDGLAYHQTFGYDHAGRVGSVSTPEITVPSQYVCTVCSPPNGLPPGYKLRPFTTSLTYDEFDNVVASNSNYWHDYTPNLNASPQMFQTTYVNNRAMKDNVPGRVYNNRDETWTYNARGQVTVDTRSSQTFDTMGQVTRTQDLSDSQVYVNYTYDGDGRQAKFDQKRADGTTELRYRIYSTVLGGLLTDINSAGQKIETRVYRFVYDAESTARQVKAYTVTLGGNPVNYPDMVVFEGSDPHRTRTVVWDHDTNTYKTVALAYPGAYVEDIDWQGLKDRFVSHIGSQISYGQYSASQYLDSYFSNINPRNPGTGCSLDGTKVSCAYLFRAAKSGALGSITVSTTGGAGGVGGDSGVILGVLTNARGSIAANKAQAGFNQCVHQCGVGPDGEPAEIGEVYTTNFFGSQWPIVPRVSAPIRVPQQQPKPICYITLVAKKVGILNWRGIGINAYHLFVLTKQSGQTAQPIYHALGGKTGKIEASTGPYGESDWDFQDVKKGGPWGSVEAVDKVQGSCDRINKNLTSTINAINAANITYDQWGDNSNAAAFTLLYQLDQDVLTRLAHKMFPKLALTQIYPTSIPPVPVLVPGWGRNLLSR